MKFLVDAQLPRSLASWLLERGHSSTHTLELELGNQTPDKSIAAVADEAGAVVITKDADFLDSHMIHGKPKKLLMVKTGNISNRRLQRIFEANEDAIIHSLESSNLVELNATGLVLHED